MKHWVLVADAAACTIYETDELFGSFTKVRSVDSAHQVEASGSASRAGAGGVHAASDREGNPRGAERSRFAHDVAGLVEDAFGRGDFERLVVASPPKFLGELRADLSARVTAKLVASIHHDFSRTPSQDLPAAVRKHLPDTAGLEM